MSRLLARSSKNNLPAQLYKDHVLGMSGGAIERAKRVSRHLKSDVAQRFIEAVQSGSEFHDLGKLTIPNQQVLANPNGKKLPDPHWKYGAYHLAYNLGDVSAALMANGHHGVLSLDEIVELHKEIKHEEVQRLLKIHILEMS